MGAVTETPPLSADRFWQLYGGQTGVELIDGKVVHHMPTGLPHGLVCANAVRVLDDWVRAHDLGRVLTGEIGIRLGDHTHRGADVCYVGYDRLPRGPLPDGPLATPPELVVEVRSPHDRWTAIHAKVAEYLTFGVPAVVVLDPVARECIVYDPDRSPVTLSAADALTLPGILPGFEAAVSAFFAGV